MTDELKNPDYDDDFLMGKVAKQSPIFKNLLLSMLSDVKEGSETEQVWLGTLNVNDKFTQIKLVVSHDVNHCIDETD